MQTTQRLFSGGLLLLAALGPRLAMGVEPTPAPAPTREIVAKGAYLAQLGDCVACHTAPEGAPLAGGRALETPFGTIYATNITPDPETGIGRYNFQQFDRVMRKGVAADGHHLYPAMPYPSYARMTEEDMRALYAYLIQGVTPVREPNKITDLRWPYSMRWGLALWNWAFLKTEPFRPDNKQDAVWNRGAYLVQGLGHCGACHTPRGIAFQEKAMTEAGRAGRHFLAGETVESWRALSLRDLWTVADTVTFLKTGQNRFATASGSMAEVIHHSTQHVEDADLVAMATYLKSLPAGEGAVRPPLPQSEPAAPAAVAGKFEPPPKALYDTRGGLAYLQFCSDCHRPDGQGVARVFPPMAGNPTVASADPATLLHITLTGGKTPATAAYPRVWTMPAFARLGDEELAEIINFVRTSWGGAAAGKDPVTAAMVKKVRATLDAKATDSTPFVTPRMADLLGQPNAQQLVRGMRLHLETRDLLPKNVGNALNCTSCHLNGGTVADGSPFVGVSAFFPSYAPRAGKEITLEERINGCFRRSMNGKPLAPDSADMKAMVAYFDWMKGETRPQDKVPGRGVGKIDPKLVANPENGKKLYADQCAVCHGESGEGLRRADGQVIYPPLWGDASFNIGAGMARTYTAAAFVKRNMPIGFHGGFPLGQGGLSDQEALDVAEYFSHQPRPDFPDKVKDWPKDPKPRDARY